MNLEANVPLSFENLLEEYRRIDTTYQCWNLALHKAEKGRLTEEDGSPYDLNIFKRYL